MVNKTKFNDYNTGKFGKKEGFKLKLIFSLSFLIIKTIGVCSRWWWTEP
jgi:hypothetical protein